MTVISQERFDTARKSRERALRAGLLRAIAATTAVLVAFACFAFGFLTCLRLKAHPGMSREQALNPPGNAAPADRNGVIESLRLFQEGYVKRDPRELGAFTRRLFPIDGDILILGTNGGPDEWARGTSAATRFIERDWRQWGDFRFDIDHSIVWCSGNVAWVATLGTVHSGDSVKPLRFTAVLTRNDAGWVFRQVHFQADDDYEPRIVDLMGSGPYLTFASHATHWITRHLNPSP